jgi:hypothetical protein
VWSSTPHGNKKLQSAYEDARRKASGKSGGCPIFLFFSVSFHYVDAFPILLKLISCKFKKKTKLNPFIGRTDLLFFNVG